MILPFLKEQLSTYHTYLIKVVCFTDSHLTQKVHVIILRGLLQNSLSRKQVVEFINTLKKSQNSHQHISGFRQLLNSRAPDTHNCFSQGKKVLFQMNMKQTRPTINTVIKVI